MANDQEAFQYTSFLQDRRIRLVFIKPLQTDGPSSLLDVRLEEESLDTADFDALSYVWGDQSQKFRICCNGRDFDIGQNLYEAMMEYRHRGTIRGLWADAICINQSHHVEKSEQVRLMGDIYSRAIRTIIWLGPLLPGDEYGIQLAETIYTRCREKDADLEERTNANDDFDWEARGISDLAYGPKTRPSWHALFEILMHPWFSRVWVIQELVMSPNPLFWRGKKSAAVRAIIWIARQVGLKRDIQTSFFKMFGSSNFPSLGITHFFYSTSAYKSHELPPIWINLLNSMGMQATDLRDRYFAIAGISACLPANFVDYSRTLEQIASQVGLLTIMGNQESQAFECLDYMADYPSIRLRARHVQMPSWVPDFFADQLRGFPLSRFYSTKSMRRQQKDFPTAELRLTIEETDGKVKQTEIPKPPCLYHKVKQIQIRAVIFDKVKTTMAPTDLITNMKFGDQNPASSGSIESLRIKFEDMYQYSARVISFIHEARLLAEPKLRHQTIFSENGLDAFWRTLIYNKTQFVYDYEAQPDKNIGISFGFWYLMLKLISSKRWEQDPGSFFQYLMLLRPLASPFKSIFDQLYGNRSFFVTDSGNIGWAPPYARPGDFIAIFQGNRIPFAARLVSGGIWEYVGGCYVHGCMDGEIWRAKGSAWDFMGFI